MGVNLTSADDTTGRLGEVARTAPVCGGGEAKTDVWADPALDGAVVGITGVCSPLVLVLRSLNADPEAISGLPEEPTFRTVGGGESPGMCPTCGGKGMTVWNATADECPDCGGTGKEKTDEA